MQPKIWKSKKKLCLEFNQDLECEPSKKIRILHGRAP